MKDLPVRKNNRLKGYNYSSNGAYFITVCVKNRHELLGKIAVGSDALGAPSVELSDNGKIVFKEIEETPSHYEGVQVDKFIVMPNHIHMIIFIHGECTQGYGDDKISMSIVEDGVPRASRPTALIPRIIAMLKKKTQKSVGFDFWQTSYHDHIIRNEEDYQNHLCYIDENPIKWAEDEYYV